jgi:hypothetical protein
VSWDKTDVFADMSTDTPKLVMLTGFINRNFKYISNNRMRFIFLLVKRFSGGVVGEPGFPTMFLRFVILFLNI